MSPAVSSADTGPPRPQQHVGLDPNDLLGALSDWATSTQHLTMALATFVSTRRLAGGRSAKSLMQPLFTRFILQTLGLAAFRRPQKWPWLERSRRSVLRRARPGLSDCPVQPRSPRPSAGRSALESRFGRDAADELHAADAYRDAEGVPRLSTRPRRPALLACTASPMPGVMTTTAVSAAPTTSTST